MEGTTPVQVDAGQGDRSPASIGASWPECEAATTQLAHERNIEVS